MPILLIALTLSGFSQVRGPYLQSGTSTSMVIRWRTDAPASSQVRYGPTPAQLNNAVSNAAEVTEHEVKLTGLSPLTKYYYSIGSTTALLQGGGDNYFQTLPATGATGLVRIGVFGDCGNNSTNQLQVRDQLRNYLGNNYMNAWILLGDNAYGSGTDAEYQANFFNYYKDNFLKQSPLYPCPGNHEYNNDGALQDNHNISYFSVYSMPINGEAGGVPSNNKAYFSFNVGNIHFLSLDSYGREDNATRLYDTLGKQAQWVKQDLAANTNKGWVVAYWHHPPYTKGNHDSDNENSLVGVRNNFITILERMGVDLILCGHSHVYERSRLMKGHYGIANTFDPAINNLSSSTGLYDGSINSCPYVKSTSSSSQGTVYVVSGSAGQLGGQQAGYPHNAMYYSNNSIGGSMMLEVQGSRLDAKWICSDGIIRDQFTMMKDVNRSKDTTVNSNTPITLTASYIGNYTWQPGNQTTRSITFNPTQGISRYIVKDNYSCIADTFTLHTDVILPLVWGSIKGRYTGNNTVQLQWQILRDDNSRHFEIERSLDGVHFTSIGRVNALATNSSIHSYTFPDKDISINHSVYFYRLKQTSATSGDHYSSVVVVKPRSLASNIDVQVVPNPAHNSEMKIRLLGANKIPAALKLTDASGRLLLNRSIVLTSTLQPFLPAIQAGTYFLSVIIESEVITKQIVVE